MANKKDQKKQPSKPEPEKIHDGIDEPMDIIDAEPVDVIVEPEGLAEVIDEKLLPEPPASKTVEPDVEEPKLVLPEATSKPVAPPPGARQRAAAPPPGARPRSQPGSTKPGTKTDPEPTQPTVPPVKRADPTQLASRKQVPKTQMAPGRGAPTTQLAPADELEQLAEEAAEGKRGAPTQLSAKQTQPTQLAPGKQAPVTQLAPAKLAPTTQLAPTKQAKPTQIVANKPAQATQLAAPGTDAGKAPGSTADSDVLEIIDDSGVLRAGTVGDDEPLVPGAGPDILDLLGEDMGKGSSVKLGGPPGEKPSGVDLIAEQLESQVGAERKKGKRAAADDDSAVDLSTAAGAPPLPIEISDDWLLTEGREPGGKKRGEDVDKTQPYDLEGTQQESDESVVIDESLLVDEAERTRGEKGEQLGIEDLVDLEPAAKRAKGKKVSAEEVEETVEAVEEEGGVAVKKSKKKRRGRDIDEDDELLRPVRRRKPHYGRRWLGGMLLGILLTAGALFAVRSFQPGWWVEMNEHMDALYHSPEATPGPIATPAQLALDKMNKGEFAAALKVAKNAGPNDKELLGIKGQVEWLMYYEEKRDQAKGKTPKLSMDDPLVKAALNDLKLAKKDTLRQQIEDTIARSDLEQQNTQVTEVEKALKLQLQANKIVDDKVDPKNIDLVKEFGNLLVAKHKAEDEAKKRDKDAKKAEADRDATNDQFTMLKKGIENLLVNEKVLPAGDPLLDDLSKAVAKALQQRKDLGTVLDMVNSKLKDAKITDTGAKGVETLVTAREKLQGDLKDLQKAAEEAYKTISEGKPLPEGADLKKELVQNALLISVKAQAPLVYSVGKVVSIVREMGGDSGLWLKAAVEKSAAELKLKIYEAREPLIDTPEKKLDTWLSLFREHSFRSATELDKAASDVAWVTSEDAKAAPEIKAKALYLQGLLSRNQEKFDEARKSLEVALKLAEDLKTPPSWKNAAASALEELTDAKAYYLPAARKLALQPGQQAAAIKQLDVGLKAIADNPDLYLERAIVQLKILPTGVKPEPAQLAAIRKDAEVARKNPATAAEANFVLGQVEEHFGSLAKAMGHYEQALAQAPKGDAQAASRYQQAIGRLLLIDPSLVPATPAESAAPAAEGKGTSSLDHGGRPLGGILSPVVTVFSVAIIAQEVDGTKGFDPDEIKKETQIKKLLELAEKLKKSDDPKVRGQGFMIYGLAASEQGKRTEGLQNYVEGLKLYYPGIEAKRLKELVDMHPAFAVPDVLLTPNPAQAEGHFGNGLHFYFDGKYQDAEAEFQKAILHHKNDARYHYYLGLSQHAQKSKKKESAAEHNIKQGAYLEVQDLPTPREINLSLERVQGSLRHYLNDIKQKAKLEVKLPEK
jgi:tetratricopeptide (TPR) repeat protein